MGKYKMDLVAMQGRSVGICQELFDRMQLAGRRQACQLALQHLEHAPAWVESIVLRQERCKLDG